MNSLIQLFVVISLVCLLPWDTNGQEMASDTTTENEIATLASRSRTAQAKSHFRKAERHESDDKLSQAIQELDRAIALKHDFNDALWLRARVHKRNGDFAEALTDYQSLLYLTPEMVEPRFERAQLFFRLERYQDAINDFRYLLENELGETTTVYFRGVTQTTADGQSSFSAQSAGTVQSGMKADIWNFLGLCYMELENYDKASFFFELALTQHTDNPNIFSNMGLASERTGDTLQAINHYRQALLLNPEHPNALQNFSYLTRKYERLDIAEETFSKISSEGSTSASLLHQGMMLHQLGNYQLAIDKYDMAIRQSPNEADLFLQRGFSKDKLGQNHGALEDYTKALTLDTQLEKAYVNRGNVYYKLKKFHTAERDYLTALQLAPNNAKTYYNLGSVHHRQGEIEKACEYLQQALSLNYSQAKVVIDKICNYQ